MSSIHKNLNYLNNQRGWVLVVGLVVLVMLTILSMELMKTTRLEEKMAGATRDMNLSFQAAETALRAAETFIESQTDASLPDAPDEWLSGIYGPTVDEDITVEWDDDNSAIAGTLEGDPLELVPLELEGVAIPAARFMIKQLEQIGDATVFRVTVRGTGGTNNRVTLLRSHYAKVFGTEKSATRALFAALGLRNVAKSTLLKSGSPKSGSPKSGSPKSGSPKSGSPKSGSPKSGKSSSGANSAGPVGRLSWEQLFPSQ